MLNATQIKEISEALKYIAKEKHIPVERLVTGIMQEELYVWDYDSGRHYQDQFRVVLTVNITPLSELYP